MNTLAEEVKIYYVKSNGALRLYWTVASGGTQGCNCLVNNEYAIKTAGGKPVLANGQCQYTVSNAHRKVIITKTV